ncbi:hypothetical protein [Duganella sp. Root1480D1]|uniref:hypothetical protein n=1 Tax=Duganella sp. Root1480D1 TaxID=1736471 RepID=UPI00070D69E3|nr:hypothetical protein [Duganella sp. Root1480D1]KQZ30208.1 hypothetical protein ASD58_09235 [Duganella sp. Root1480D1]
MIERFDEYIEVPYSPDFWYDVGLPHASCLADQFQCIDWQQLSALISQRPDEWKIRCAEAIDPYQNEQAAKLLISLLTVNNGDIIVAAASSLRTFDGLPSLLAPGDLARVRNLIATASAPVRMVLQDFLRRAEPVLPTASPK